MARGRKTALHIRLTPADRQTLRSWQRSTTIPAGRARRGRIIGQLADGVPISHTLVPLGPLTPSPSHAATAPVRESR